MTEDATVVGFSAQSLQGCWEDINEQKHVVKVIKESTDRSNKEADAKFKDSQAIPDFAILDALMAVSSTHLDLLKSAGGISLNSFFVGDEMAQHKYAATNR